MVNPTPPRSEPPDDRHERDHGDHHERDHGDRHLDVDAESDETGSRYSIGMTPQEAFSRAHAQKLKHLQEQEPKRPPLTEEEVDELYDQYHRELALLLASPHPGSSASRLGTDEGLALPEEEKGEG